MLVGEHDAVTPPARSAGRRSRDPLNQPIGTEERKAGGCVAAQRKRRPHVHAVKAGAVVKIALDTCQAVEIVGRISNLDVKRAEALVAQYADFLRSRWKRIHAKR
jgi:uncharacterized protein DUF4160